MPPKTITVHVPGDCRGTDPVDNLLEDERRLIPLFMEQSEEVQQDCLDMLTDMIEMWNEGYSLAEIEQYTRRVYGVD